MRVHSFRFADIEIATRANARWAGMPVITYLRRCRGLWKLTVVHLLATQFPYRTRWEEK